MEREILIRRKIEEHIREIDYRINLCKYETSDARCILLSAKSAALAALATLETVNK